MKKFDIRQKNLPQHVAIIMDGNGRWAVQRGMRRTRGHFHAIETVKEIVDAIVAVGIPYLTLYTFSMENWKRPKEEVEELMSLVTEHLHGELGFLQQHNIKLKFLGDLSTLPERLVTIVRTCVEKTKENSRLTLNLALNYSGRWEITEAVKKIAKAVEAHRLSASDITEDYLSTLLHTHYLPDPELLIRTGGEVRISNFLLWQIAYTEMYFSKVLFPDFDKACLYEALATYATRKRRFGTVGQETLKQ